jgi:hypothetical protein
MQFMETLPYPNEENNTVLDMLNKQMEEQRQLDQQALGLADELTTLLHSAQLDPDAADDVHGLISQLRGVRRGTPVRALINQAHTEIANLSDEIAIHSSEVSQNVTHLSPEAKEMLDTAEHQIHSRVMNNKALFILADELAEYNIPLQGSIAEQLLIAEAIAALSQEQRTTVLSLTNGDISAQRITQILAYYGEEELTSVASVNHACSVMHDPHCTETDHAQKILAVASLAIALEVGREIVNEHIAQKQAQLHHHTADVPVATINSGKAVTHEGRLAKAPVLELLPVHASN